MVCFFCGRKYGKREPPPTLFLAIGEMCKDCVREFDDDVQTKNILFNIKMLSENPVIKTMDGLGPMTKHIFEHEKAYRSKKFPISYFNSLKI